MVCKFLLQSRHNIFPDRRRLGAISCAAKAFLSLRGFVWDRLLALLKMYGVAAQDLLVVWNLALDDPYISPEYGFSLREKFHAEQFDMVVVNKRKSVSARNIDTTPDKKKYRVGALGGGACDPRLLAGRYENESKVYKQLSGLLRCIECAFYTVRGSLRTV
jgi:hypothetical protein